MATLVRVWSLEQGTTADSPRSDLVVEQAVDGAPGTYRQLDGPFVHYERTVTTTDNAVHETTWFRLAVPWFGWLFALPVRRALGRPPGPARLNTVQPWWAPPDRLTPRSARIIGLLAAASVVVGYVNTLFTQTVSFAAIEFGVSDGGKGVAGTVVRAGILLVLPLLALADRIGRRRVLIGTAVGATVFACLGAASPSFAVLTASQAIGRPLGLALDVLIAVYAAEEMGKGARAYAVAVLGMAAGLGAGFCVMALPLADIGINAWRLVYLPPILFLLVAVDLARRLPESQRFVRSTRNRAPISRSRLGLLAATGCAVNLFLAPLSFFQNSYLQDIRGFSASAVSIFTLCTATPAGLGVIIGGRLADSRGRRGVGVTALVISAALLAASYGIGGWPMWMLAFLGGFFGGVSGPALAVFRTELFPTDSRSLAGGLITAVALVSGSIGLLAVGELRDRGISYGPIMAGLALGPVLAAILVWVRFPETAHKELEELS